MTTDASRMTELTRKANRDLDSSRAALAVLRAASLLSRGIERALTAADLTLPQFNVLMELAASAEGMAPMSDVVERMVTTPPSLSWLTNKMRDDGLILKRRDLEDARVVLLAITEPGWQALEVAMPHVFDIEKQLLVDYRKAELRSLVRMLEPLLG